MLFELHDSVDYYDKFTNNFNILFLFFFVSLIFVFHTNIFGRVNIISYPTPVSFPKRRPHLPLSVIVVKSRQVYNANEPRLIYECLVWACMSESTYKKDYEQLKIIVPEFSWMLHDIPKYLIYLVN